MMMLLYAVAAFFLIQETTDSAEDIINTLSSFLTENKMIIALAIGAYIVYLDQQKKQEEIAFQRQMQLAQVRFSA